MSEKEDNREIWEDSLTDQTCRPVDTGILNEFGKSQSPNSHEMNPCLTVTDNARLERLKLQQERVEEEFTYQIKKLQLEHQISRARFESKLAQLEAGHVPDSIKIDDEVRISSNLDARPDLTAFNDVLCKLDLPRLELPYFDGDSSQYHYFIREFETHIESRIQSPSQRLSYLLHYCKGRARRAISGCVMLPGPEGYLNARSILSNMFGRPHVVAKSLLDRITVGRVVKNTSEDLWELSIEMQNCFTTLNQMSYISDLNSHTTIERVARRLPCELQQRWVEKASEIYEEGREPLFQDLREFVARRARVAGCRYNSILAPREEHRISVSNQGTGRLREKASSSAVSFNSSVSRSLEECFLCKQNHNLDECSSFSSMSIGDRWRHVLRGKRCLVCLKPGHVASACKQPKRCDSQGCNELHHQMLHKDRSDSSHSVNATRNVTKFSNCRRKITFGIIAVNVVGPKDSQLTYALIDNGSDSTFISQSLAQRIGITGERASITIKTLSSIKTERSSKVSFAIEPVDGNERVNVDRAFTISELDLGLGCPLSIENINQWKHLSDIKITNLGQSEIELLIGNDTPEAHWAIEQRIGNRHQPFAVRTVLGWIPFGPSGNDSTLKNSMCLLSSCSTIEQQITRLYNNEFEDVAQHDALSIEDSEALRQVKHSISFENGHFVIGLPWKLDRSKLPDNIVVAQRRLSQLKKRFISDVELYDKYKDLIQRHFDLGYAVPVSDVSLRTDIRWYLPHHPVLNPKKPGKVRIVFDCAAKHHGMSLNDYLLQGPNMVQNLVAVLTRFRKGMFALTGDIQEMFLQVKVPESDRNVLRFLWWDGNDYNKEIKEFQLTVHPFGAVSSPFCASFALQQSIKLYNGKLEQHVARALENNFYVDDCLLSCDSEVELDELRHELSYALRLAGFNLTKWTSNSRLLLKNVPSLECAQSTVNLNFQTLPTERTLGMQWDAQCDCFKFDINLPDRPLTRRGMLSCVSSLYDPLGLVCPVLLPAKQILQELCRSKMGWDDPVDVETSRLWKRWLSSMERLREIRIQRCIKPPDSVMGSAPELHIFSDASERGYGVAAYLRYANNKGSFHCALLFGKSRVTPLKAVSVPRLELTAAVLAVRVASLVFRETLVEPSKVYYWTDSMTVLYYLANTTSRFATFVANRVSYILEHSRAENWMFVKGSENPADYASRGLSPEDSKFQIWLNGPEFLKSPLEPNEMPKQTMMPEGCELKRVHYTTAITLDSPLRSLFSHYSSWLKLQRAVVWLTRFKTYLSIIHGLRQDSSVRLGPIMVEEMERATTDIIVLVQREAFSSEIDDMKTKGKCVRLAKLNPRLHKQMLVLGGRLQATNSSCKPILPPNHVVTNLIIRHYHVLEGHSGIQQVLSALRRQFWVVNGVTAVKRVLNDCAKCKYLNASPMQQQMADLPECRVTPGTYAFDSCGLDYFGPLLVQQNRSVVKRWGCLFTCMRSRAVHIEIVHTLSTDSFLMALIRFIGRRGCPKEIFSDNGSNFVGADTELRKELRLLSQERISDHLLARGIQWHFNPPGSSHRGGVWERLIRSVRKNLRVILSGHVVKEEVLLTALAEIERILNNRPLVPVYDDARDVAALTPNDLLLLRSIEPVVCDASIDIRRYTRWWKQAWHLSNQFWKRWVSDYLPTLELRKKWLFPRRNLKVGDIVLVASEIGSKDDWPLGRVVATYPGSDGLVRKVDVITKKGKLHRDIRKLCFLEGDVETRY